MSIKHEDKIRENSEGRRVSLERFAYDVFSYMLPICGFNEKIASSKCVENDYIDKDFVKKSGLSVLPLSMFVRDSWKNMFEYRHWRHEFENSEKIKKYLMSTLTTNADFKASDDATKVRISLSFFNELTLFLNYKGFETDLDKLAELWREFYLEHVSRNRDIEGIFSSSFFMFPEATESPEWLISFVEEFAVPYGRINKVSHLFSVYSIVSENSESSPLKKISNKEATANLVNVPGTIGKKPTDVLKSNPKAHKDSSPELGLENIVSENSESSPLKKTSSKEATANLANIPGTIEKKPTDVLKSNPKAHKDSSPELRLEDTSGQRTHF